MSDRQLRRQGEKIAFFRSIEEKLEDVLLKFDDKKKFVRLSDEEISFIQEPIYHSLKYIDKLFKQKGVR